MSEERQMPAAPVGITDADQIAGAEERWEHCPLRDCKRKNELLYEDFYLRDIRTNRLMCSACAVRVEMGYMAREVVKATDDRYFQGNQLDNLIVFGVMASASGLASLLIINLFLWFYFAFIIGGIVGGVAAAFARKWTGRRVTRQTPYFGVAGAIVGAFAAILGYSMFTGFPFEFVFQAQILSVGATIAGVLAAAWGVLHRRI